MAIETKFEKSEEVGRKFPDDTRRVATLGRTPGLINTQPIYPGIKLLGFLLLFGGLGIFLLQQDSNLSAFIGAFFSVIAGQILLYVIGIRLELLGTNP